MKIYMIYLFLFFVAMPSFFLFSQKSLQILKSKRKGLVKYEVFKDDDLTYKTKGRLFYRTARITNMNDSVLLLNDSIKLALKDIRKIKLNNREHIMETLTGAAFIGGAGYLFLNGANNLILNSVLRIDPRAAIVSSSLIGAGIILKQLGYKRIRVNKRVVLKVLQTNYHFNSVPEN